VKDNLSDGLEIYDYIILDGKVTNKYKYFINSFNKMYNIS